MSLYKNPSVWFRVDCHKQIGYGHVSRCLNLATYFYDQGYEITFIGRGYFENQIPNIYKTIHLSKTDKLITSDPQTWLASTIEEDTNECIEYLHKSTSFSIKGNNLLAKSLVDIMIIDHYNIHYEWEHIIKPYVGKLIVIDDLCRTRTHDCDFYIDYTFRLNDKNIVLPKIPHKATALLGSSYCLLNKNFSLPHYQKLVRINMMNTIPSNNTVPNNNTVSNNNTTPNNNTVPNNNTPSLNNVQTLLINFGGSDVQNQTIEICEALVNNFNDLNLPALKKIYIVCGGFYENMMELLTITQQISKHIEINILQSITQENMIEILTSADLCIGSGGVAAYERCCVGLPSIVISVAENQKENVSNMANYGAIYYLGHYDEWTPTQLAYALNKCNVDGNLMKNMTEKGLHIVDGSGCQRTLAAVTNKNW